MIQRKKENILISVPKKENEDIPNHYKGHVEYFSSSKGYGFIKDMNKTDKYFFHISNAPEDITEGCIVSFDLEKGDRGMNAVNITYTGKTE